jgi:nicotinate phosphoribosyltransferase
MDKTGKFTPTMKLSKGKITLPGRKQVFRVNDKDGDFIKDIIAVHDERIEGEPLLLKVMKEGEIVYDLPTLEDVRKRAIENLSKLPEEIKKLKKAKRYTVTLSPKLRKLQKELTNELKKIESQGLT